MDDENQTPVVPAPAEPVAPAEGSAAPSEPAVPAPGSDNPEAPVPPAPEKPAGDKPPEDPNAAEKPADPEKPAEPAPEQPVDLKSMSRAERASYFQQIDANTRKDVEAKVNAAYQPQPVDELTQKYIDEGHTEFEAKMLAREEVRDQENDISRARAERAELNATLAIEAQEVLSTIDWLNPGNKAAFDEKSSEAATSLYDELCLTRDENTAERDASGNPIPGTGQVIGATMSPKQFYQLVDTIRSSGTETAKLTAQKNAELQMGAVAPPSSNSNKTEKSFDDMSAAEQRAALQAKGLFVT